MMKFTFENALCWAGVVALFALACVTDPKATPTRTDPAPCLSDPTMAKATAFTSKLASDLTIAGDAWMVPFDEDMKNPVAECSLAVIENDLVARVVDVFDGHPYRLMDTGGPSPHVQLSRITSWRMVRERSR